MTKKKHIWWRRVWGHERKLHGDTM